MLKIDSTKCIQCGLCELLCPTEAINNQIIDDQKCIACAECYQNCTENAINEIS